MKIISALRVLFIFCACCTGDSVLFQPSDSTLQTKCDAVDQPKVDGMFDIVLGLIFPDTNTNDEEINDLTEGEEFLSSRPIIVQCSFGLDASKSKIPTQQNLLHHPFLEKSTPPPKLNS